MKVQTAFNTVSYDRTAGAEFLASILPLVTDIATVKTVQAVEVVKVAKAWRVFWIIFWILVFWPFAIIAFFIAGISKELTWLDGEFNVTLSTGHRYVITGNDDFLVDFTNQAKAKSFLK